MSETVAGAGQTSAALMSLIIKTVYRKCEFDYETNIYKGVDKKFGYATVKKICCYMVREIVTGFRDKEMQKIMHISDQVYRNYVSEMQGEVMTKKEMLALVLDIEYEVMEVAVKEFKYSAFVKQSVKRKVKFNL